MKESADYLLITCEHGGSRVPKRYTRLFHRRQRLLRSHRGWDPGSLLLARELARGLKAQLITATVTRLLVDLNRSPGHRALFSELSRGLDADEKRRILKHWYIPYRSRVEHAVAAAMETHRRVIHLSIHSFTPALNGVIRHADIGLLYDPARPEESEYSSRILEELGKREPLVCLRRNFPYRGTADGFTTYLRKRFPENRYLGMELEVNQIHAAGHSSRWAGLRRSLKDSIRAAI